MLRPAWLCHQRRAVVFSVAQFQPDFIFDAVRGLFPPLLVGVAPAIPTTPVQSTPVRPLLCWGISLT